ncbi:hypothetical protein CF98_02965 [Halopseudomonas bauzanensis]|nr:hypothetical protein CF98_02965 [Halopseudomonas bauzanensis]
MAVSEHSSRKWRWLALAVAVLLLALASYFASQYRPAKPAAAVPVETPAPPVVRNQTPADFIGSASCAGCHSEQHQAWQESQHAHAMAHASADTVLADFNDSRFEYAGTVSRFQQRDGRYFVTTDGADGQLTEYEVLYTFGLDPLQQYLVDLGGGRLQALSIAWDTRPHAAGGQRWFHLYPDEQVRHDSPLHWTGPAQNWNFMCADCHVTDYRKGFDAQTQSFAAEWSELGVGCEACHGPGSRHLQWTQGQEWPDKGLTLLLDERQDMHWLHELERVTARRSVPLSTDKEQQVCAQCHSLRSATAEGYHAGLPLLDFYRPELLSDPLYFADGQQREEVFISGSFAQSRMHAAGVTCSDCHQPHSQALRAEGNALCSSCHLPTEFDRPTHHYHAADSSGAQCVSCHMPERTYMVIDPRRDHNIAVPRPDLARQLGTPDACTGCHTDREPDWAAQQIAGWFPEGRWQQASPATTIAAADQGLPAAQQDLATLVNDPQLAPIVRGSAAQRLQPQLGQVQQQAVAKGLQDPDPLVRLGSIRALGDGPAALRRHYLAPLLADPLRSLRSLAASQLVDVDLPPAIQPAFERALREYEEELALHAERSSHLGQLALLRLRQGRAGEAEEAWSQAIKAAPLDAANYLNLADLYRAQGREKTAERLLREALVILPAEGMLHYALGLSLVRQQQREAALEHLQRAWMLQPDEPRTGYVLAVAVEPSAPEEALTILRQAGRLHPTDRDVLWAGASFSFRHGQPGLAREFVDALLERDPGDQQALELARRLPDAATDR